MHVSTNHNSVPYGIVMLSKRSASKHLCVRVCKPTGHRSFDSRCSHQDDVLFAFGTN